MSQNVVNAYPNPDRAALVRAGQVVRKRLAAQPEVHRIPTDRLEVFGVQNFISPHECAALCRMIDRNARPSQVYDHGYPDDYRTSWSGNLARDDAVVLAVEARIDRLLALPHTFGEPLQGQRYQPGQQFKQHNDWFYTLAPYWKTEAKRGGQRCFTAMAYLNAVEGGGTTQFTHLDLSIPPQPGALLIWNNATANGFPNDDAMHAGMPVIAGQKYVITKWYRTRKWG